MKKYSISVFFPVYNDAKTIPTLVSNIIPILKRITDDYEIILVNDGSTDNSREVVEMLAKKYRNIRPIHHKQNTGYGGALKTGISNAKKEWIFYTDGDGQYDVRELEKLTPWMDQTDVVNGYKIKRFDSYPRKYFGFIYRCAVNLLFNIKIKDVDCDFRLMKRKVFDSIKLNSNSGFIAAEMISKIQRAGFKTKDVPVHHYPRVEGRSQFFKFNRVIEVFKDLTKEWLEMHTKVDK